MSRPTLTVYSRAYCHLCDEMIAGLRELQARFQFDFETVDVDADEALERLYGADVPVLAHDKRELCRHALNTRVVTAYLVQIG